MSDTSQDVDPTNGKPYQAPPRWSAATKRVVTSGILILAALVLYRFRVVIGPLTIAFLLAIVVHPIVTFISRRGHISRGLATGVVFIVLILVMLGSLAAPVTAVGALQRAVRSLQFDLTALIDEIGDFLARPVEILGYSL
ncbi:MAG: AI-2E family transporter, partial [Anaerolineales bacterium]|nr:AI-2E family transporter [Anaerolineales bacterium]